MSMRERIKSSLAHASGSVRCHFGTFETARRCLRYFGRQDSWRYSQTMARIASSTSRRAPWSLWSNAFTSLRSADS